MKPLLDTYFSSYKDSAYYWTGFLLLMMIHQNNNDFNVHFLLLSDKSNSNYVINDD